MPGPGDQCASPFCAKTIPEGMRADAKYHSDHCKREARLARQGQPPSGLIRLSAIRPSRFTPPQRGEQHHESRPHIPGR